MTGFHIDADHLRTHAGHLDDAGEKVGLATGAVSTVHLDTHAFGLMCAGLIPFVSDHEHKTAGLITDAGSALSRCGEGMREMANEYDGVDTSAEQRFRAFDASLGG